MLCFRIIFHFSLLPLYFLRWFFNFIIQCYKFIFFFTFLDSLVFNFQESLTVLWFLFVILHKRQALESPWILYKWAWQLKGITGSWLGKVRHFVVYPSNADDFVIVDFFSLFDFWGRILLSYPCSPGTYNGGQAYLEANCCLSTLVSTFFQRRFLEPAQVPPV